MAAELEECWTGGQGLVYYGDSTLMYADQWSVTMSMDVIDISNIGVYRLGGFPNGLPAKDRDPKKPFDRKMNGLGKDAGGQGKYEVKQAQYGAGRSFLEGNLRAARITCSGLCSTYDEILKKNRMPRIGNYVYFQFSNEITRSKTIFEFPNCIVNEVTYELAVRGYQRWTLQAVSTVDYTALVQQPNTDFDIFPGTEPE